MLSKIIGIVVVRKLGEADQSVEFGISFVYCTVNYGFNEILEVETKAYFEDRVNSPREDKHKQWTVLFYITVYRNIVCLQIITTGTLTSTVIKMTK